MEQFTFYEWYADILQSMDDISAGKLANCICAYEFEDREPMEQYRKYFERSQGNGKYREDT